MSLVQWNPFRELSLLDRPVAGVSGRSPLMGQTVADGVGSRLSTFTKQTITRWW